MPVKSKVVKVCVHEWGGYQLEREKSFSKKSAHPDFSVADLHRPA